MKRDTAVIIRAMYDTIEEQEPDISTERLLQMTIDYVHMAEGLTIDVSNIITALDMIGRT